jgi:hypothetical protein
MYRSLVGFSRSFLFWLPLPPLNNLLFTAPSRILPGPRCLSQARTRKGARCSHNGIDVAVLTGIYGAAGAKG